MADGQWPMAIDHGIDNHDDGGDDDDDDDSRGSEKESQSDKDDGRWSLDTHGRWRWPMELIEDGFLSV